MNETQSLIALQQQTLFTLLAALGVGGVFGWVIQRSHFCTMGALSDVMYMGSWVRLRLWALVVAVAMWGFAGLVATGSIQPHDHVYAAPRIYVLAAWLGGGLFGVGMVLGSGCGSKTLVRLGGGSLKALVVFLVMGISAYIAIRGIVAVLRVRMIETIFWEPSWVTLPQMIAAWTSLSLQQSMIGTAGGVGVGLVIWVMRDAAFRQKSGVFLWINGIILGGCVTVMWWVSGHLGYLPEHPQTLEATYLATASTRMEALSFTAPMSETLDWLMRYSDTSKHLTLGVMVLVGVIVGGGVSAMQQKQFRWEGFQSTADTARHLVGAMLMGVGGVMAMGCTIGQGLSGLSTLSFQSMLAVLGIAMGAIGCLWWQLRQSN